MSNHEYDDFEDDGSALSWHRKRNAAAQARRDREMAPAPEAEGHSDAAAAARRSAEWRQWAKAVVWEVLETDGVLEMIAAETSRHAMECAGFVAEKSW